MKLNATETIQKKKKGKMKKLYGDDIEARTIVGCYSLEVRPFRAKIMQISVEIQLGREQSRMRIAEGTAAT